MTVEGLTRRTMLRRSGAAALALGVPSLLAACGKTTPKPKNSSIYVIHVGEGAPRTEDLVPLLTREAKALHMQPILSTGETSPEALKQTLAPGAYNPETNKASTLSGPVVFYATEAAKLEPIAADAIGRGNQLIPYPVAMKHQSAAIVFDAKRAAAELAAQAIAWANRHAQGSASVVLVPPDPSAGINPLAVEAAEIERAWRSALGQASGLSVAATVAGYGEPLGEEQVAAAVRSTSGACVVLCWEDQVAIGAAKALRAKPLAATDAGSLLVCCMGAPVAYTRATFEELESGGPFQLMVTARASDLADAMVELPQALLAGGSADSVTLPLSVLTPGSKLTAEFSDDYLRHESDGYQNYESVPLNGGAL